MKKFNSFPVSCYIILFLLLPLLAPAGLQSSTVLKFSFSELVRESDAIVIGTVIAKEYENTRAPVLTKNIVEIETCLSGQDRLQEAGMEIVTLGGKMGNGYSVHVFGEAHFKVGERFIAFLRLRGGRWCVTGMAQGKMTIKQDKKSGAALVLPPDKVNLVSRKNGKLVKEHPFMTKPVPLDELVDAVLLEKESNAP